MGGRRQLRQGQCGTRVGTFARLTKCACLCPAHSRIRLLAYVPTLSWRNQKWGHRVVSQIHWERVAGSECLFLRDLVLLQTSSSLPMLPPWRWGWGQLRGVRGMRASSGQSSANFCTHASSSGRISCVVALPLCRDMPAQLLTIGKGAGEAPCPFLPDPILLDCQPDFAGQELECGEWSLRPCY